MSASWLHQQGERVISVRNRLINLLKPETSLPLKELMAEFGPGDSITVQSAIADLADEGIIEVQNEGSDLVFSLSPSARVAAPSIEPDKRCLMIVATLAESALSLGTLETKSVFLDILASE